MKSFKMFVMVLVVSVMVFGLAGCAEEEDVDYLTLTLTIGGSATGYTNYIFLFTENIANPELNLNSSVARTSLVDNDGESAIIETYDFTDGTDYYLFAYGDKNGNGTVDSGDWIISTGTALDTAQCFTVSIDSNTSYEIANTQWHVAD